MACATRFEWRVFRARSGAAIVARRGWTRSRPTVDTGVARDLAVDHTRQEIERGHLGQVDRERLQVDTLGFVRVTELDADRATEALGVSPFLATVAQQQLRRFVVVDAGCDAFVEGLTCHLDAVQDAHRVDVERFERADCNCGDGEVFVRFQR